MACMLGGKSPSSLVNPIMAARYLAAEPPPASFVPWLDSGKAGRVRSYETAQPPLLLFEVHRHCRARQVVISRLRAPRTCARVIPAINTRARAAPSQVRKQAGSARGPPQIMVGSMTSELEPLTSHRATHHAALLLLSGLFKDRDADVPLEAHPFAPPYFRGPKGVPFVLPEHLRNILFGPREDGRRTTILVEDYPMASGPPACSGFRYHKQYVYFALALLDVDDATLCGASEFAGGAAGASVATAKARSSRKGKGAAAATAATAIASVNYEELADDSPWPLVHDLASGQAPKVPQPKPRYVLLRLEDLFMATQMTGLNEADVVVQRLRSLISFGLRRSAQSAGKLHLGYFDDGGSEPDAATKAAAAASSAAHLRLLESHVVRVLCGEGDGGLGAPMDRSGDVDCGSLGVRGSSALTLSALARLKLRNLAPHSEPRRPHNTIT